MKFNLKITPRSSSHKVKGIGSDIPYVVRLSSAIPDWAPEIALTDWEEQRFGWNGETDECWEWSGINDAAAQIALFIKLGQLPQTHMDFLRSNGYLNAQGQVSISRRYLGILSGVKDEGGDSTMFWGLAKRYGMIPRSMLDFTPTAANSVSREAFVADYYDRNAVTDAMIALGRKFLEFFNLDFEFVGNDGITPPPQDLMASLYQSPLQIGIPVPQDVFGWNKNFIDYDGTPLPAHEVLLYKVDFANNPKYPYFILDQYEPRYKQLSANYLLYRVTNGVVTPKISSQAAVPIQAIAYPSQSNVFVKIWNSIWVYFNDGIKTGGVPRSSKWSRVRNDFLKGKSCAVCGTDKSLNAHHIVAFHTDMAKELDPTNLIALCEGMNKDCHRLVGHLGNYQSINENCIEDAKMLNIKILNRPKWNGIKWIYNK